MLPTMVHKNIAIKNSDDVIKTYLADGADLGVPYFSDKSFKKEIRCLFHSLELIMHFDRKKSPPPSDIKVVILAS